MSLHFLDPPFIRCAMTDRKTSISVRVPEETHKKMIAISKSLHIDTTSQLYRWAIESFIEEILDEAESPDVPAIVELARRSMKGRKRKR